MTLSPLSTPSPSGFVGSWSYLVEQNRCFVDQKLPGYFGALDAEARAGLTLEGYFGNIDSKDRSFLHGEIAHAIATQAEMDVCYRIESARYGHRVLRALGRCYYDQESGTPIVLSGGTFDITPRNNQRGQDAIQRLFDEALRLAMADRKTMLTYFIELAKREAEETEW